MKRFIFLVVTILLALPAQAEWQYPPTKTVDASDTYFGKTYKDPYRWIENINDKEVEDWFKAQADLTDGLLAKIPGRDALADEWMALDKLKPATMDQIERITEMLLESSRRSGYMNPVVVSSTENKVRRMVRRLRITASDAAMWLGMLRQILWKLRNSE